MSVSATLVSKMALALLTTMSMPPKCAAVRAIASLTAPSSRMSTASANARPPAASISTAAVWMVPGSLGWGVSVFAAIAILAPSRAARSATARPMPREAPVMKSVLPLRDMGDSGVLQLPQTMRRPFDSICLGSPCNVERLDQDGAVGLLLTEQIFPAGEPLDLPAMFLKGRVRPQTSAFGRIKYVYILPLQA